MKPENLLSSLVAVYPPEGSSIERAGFLPGERAPQSQAGASMVSPTLHCNYVELMSMMMVIHVSKLVVHLPLVGPQDAKCDLLTESEIQSYTRPYPLGSPYGRYSLHNSAV